MSNKENKKVTFTYSIAIVITLILAALKLDGYLNISWLTVILPIIIDVVLGLLISLIVLLWLAVEKIREAIRKNNYEKLLYNARTSVNSIYWDYKTQSMYDSAGNKIDDTAENNEEQD